MLEEHGVEANEYSRNESVIKEKMNRRDGNIWWFRI